MGTRDSSTKTMNLKNLLRGKNFSSETKLSRKVLIQNRSLVPILPLFTCSPSMNAERTPELMETERNSMKEVLRFCELKPWNQLAEPQRLLHRVSFCLHKFWCPFCVHTW